MQKQEPTPRTALDPSLYAYDSDCCSSGFCRKKEVCSAPGRGAGEAIPDAMNNVPTRDCLLPPCGDLEQHAADGTTKKERAQDIDSRKKSSRKKSRKKSHTSSERSKPSRASEKEMRKSHTESSERSKPSRSRASTSEKKMRKSHTASSERSKSSRARESKSEKKMRKSHTSERSRSSRATDRTNEKNMRKRENEKSRRPKKSTIKTNQTAPLPTRSKERKNDKQRAIPESLVGSQVSWSSSSSSLHVAFEDLPLLHEDFVNSASRTLEPRMHHRKSSDKKAPIQDVELDVVSESRPSAEPTTILLDANGFPIQGHDHDNSARSLNVRGFVTTTTSTHKLDESFTSSTDTMTRSGSLVQGSLPSVERAFAESHQQLHESIASNDNLFLPVSLQEQPKSTERIVTRSRSNLRVPRKLREELVKIDTAVAFEAFLRRQHEMTKEKCVSSGDSTHSWSIKGDDDDKEAAGYSSYDDMDDPFKHLRLTCRGSESSLLSCGDDDVKLFQEIDESGSPSFGRVLRNESFVKRVSSRDLL